MPRLTKRAEQEIAAFGLDSDVDYCEALIAYMNAYEQAPPERTHETRNGLKALRTRKWMNTTDDWARLHATEAFLGR